MKLKFLILAMLFTSWWGVAQTYDFEDTRPSEFFPVNSTANISADRYKDGSKSLCWEWTSEQAELRYNNPSALTRKGLTLWIYNETPHDKPLRFQFIKSGTNIPYWFDFGLDYKGWRACWIAFADMEGEKGGQTGLTRLNIKPPEGVNSGRIYFDRWSFVTSTTDRPTPDKQLPNNGDVSQPFKDHWTRLWVWEQYEYDMPIPSSITSEEQADLETMESRLTSYWVGGATSGAGVFSTAEASYNQAQIRRSGDNIYGAPFVNDDEVKTGEMSWAKVGAMFANYALAYHLNYNRQVSAQRIIDVFDYMQDQGFAYGSSMGTNHHYGYQTRDFPKAFWLARQVLQDSGRYEAAFKTIEYWSGLATTRISERVVWPDGIVDAWNTLSLFKLTAAMMFETRAEQLRAMRCFTRWMSASVDFSPGTVGGLKADGTHFHHGGLYPAYFKDALGGLNPYFELLQGTSFILTESARKNLKFTMQTMRNYSNLSEWGIGVCGRHPFTNVTMSAAALQSMGNIAKMGDLSGSGDVVDRELAADFLRLNNNASNDLKTYFESLGITKASAPEGFWAYNHASLGVLRRDEWMVNLKGYNTDVWGSEIYQKDNRYGRYQSYGSIQIFAGGSPVSNPGSGYKQQGWDWNRLPGTTTLHLPNSRLNSPNSGSLMEKSTENFSGASSLEGKNGIFATKIKEKQRTNFTPSFVARKSAFCFDNRIICIGSGISNVNTVDSTETTLFQTSTLTTDPVVIDGQSYVQFPLDLSVKKGALTQIVDNQNITYWVPANQDLRVKKSTQQSNDNKSMAATSGDFAVAYIQHGVSPKNATYEYMIHILPSEDERAEVLSKGLPYLVKSRDTIAHVVQDNVTGVVGYACFRKYIPTNDLLINSIDEESLVMVDKKHADTILMSIADPNLNIEDKSYTTSEPSRPIIKKLTLNGGYVLLQDDDRVKYTATAQRTELEIEVVLGLPVEFTLVKGTGTNITSVSKKREQLPVLLYPNPTNDVVNILFTEDILGKASVKVYSQYGTLVKTLPSQETMSVMSIDISNLPTGVYYIQIVVDGKSIVKPIVKL